MSILEALQKIYEHVYCYCVIEEIGENRDRHHIMVPEQAVA